MTEILTAKEESALLANLRAGDEVAYVHHSFSTTIRRIAKVEKVTPSGRIIAEGQTFNPDGSERGGWEYGPTVRLQALTPALRKQIAEEMEARHLVRRLEKTEWKKVPLKTLRAVAALLPEPRKRKE